MGVKHFARAVAMAWNFNIALGQRVNRSIVRHIRILNQLGKAKGVSIIAETLLETVGQIMKDEHSAAVGDLRELLAIDLK